MPQKDPPKSKSITMDPKDCVFDKTLINTEKQLKKSMGLEKSSDEILTVFSLSSSPYK